jgi:hypothetical protein
MVCFCLIQNWTYVPISQLVGKFVKVVKHLGPMLLNYYGVICQNVKALRAHN